MLVDDNINDVIVLQVVVVARSQGGLVDVDLRVLVKVVVLVVLVVTAASDVTIAIVAAELITRDGAKNIVMIMTYCREWHTSLAPTR